MKPGADNFAERTPAWVAMEARALRQSFSAAPLRFEFSRLAFARLHTVDNPYDFDADELALWQYTAGYLAEFRP